MAKHTKSDTESAETIVDEAHTMHAQATDDASSHVEQSPNAVQAAPDPDDASEFVENGYRVRKTLVTRMLIPTDDKDWILKNIVGGGKGTRATLGKVIGIANGSVERMYTFPDGKQSAMIALMGDFEMVNYGTGEVTRATSVYLPPAYALLVHGMFPQDKEAAKLPGALRTVEIDVEIGIEATGKTIPYEWVAIAYREGKAMDVLRRLRNSRPVPKKLLLTGPGATPLLTQSTA